MRSAWGKGCDENDIERRTLRESLVSHLSREESEELVSHLSRSECYYDAANLRKGRKNIRQKSYSSKVMTSEG